MHSMDVAATINSMSDSKRGLGRLTWSRYEQFNGCESHWLLSNFYVSTSPTLSLSDNNLSFEGNMIQKFVELYYRDIDFANRVNHTMNLGRDQFYSFVKRCVEALDYCTVLLPKTARDLEMDNAYKWADTPKGSSYIGAKLAEFGQMQEGGLTVEVDKIVRQRTQILIVDKPNLTDYRKTDYKTALQSVIDRLVVAMPRLASGLPFSMSGAEVWVAVHLQGIEVCGMVDLITNRQGNIKADRMWNVRDNYIMVDGKNQLNYISSHDQLQFYATILKLKQNVTPSSLSLYGYRENEVRPVNFDTKFIDGMNETLTRYHSTITGLKQRLLDQGDRIAEPWKFMKRTPTKCKFCPANQDCDMSTELRAQDGFQQYKALSQEADFIITEQLGVGDNGLPNNGEISL